MIERLPGDDPNPRPAAVAKRLLMCVGRVTLPGINENMFLFIPPEPAGSLVADDEA